MWFFKNQAREAVERRLTWTDVVVEGHSVQVWFSEKTGGLGLPFNDQPDPYVWHSIAEMIDGC